MVNDTTGILTGQIAKKWAEVGGATICQPGVPRQVLGICSRLEGVVIARRRGVDQGRFRLAPRFLAAGKLILRRRAAEPAHIYCRLGGTSGISSSYRLTVLPRCKCSSRLVLLITVAGQPVVYFPEARKVLPQSSADVSALQDDPSASLLKTYSK